MNKTKGIIFALISAITYGIAPILISITYKLGNNSMMMTFLRNFMVLPFLLIYIAFKGYSLKINKEQLKKLIIISVCGFSASLVALYSSYKYIPPALASSLNFVYPTIVAVLSVIVFKEEMSRARKLAVISSLTGIILFMDFKNGGPNSYIGIGLALCSGIIFAFYMIYLAKSGILQLPPIVVTFYMSLISSITMAAVTIISGNFVPGNIQTEGWLLILLISLLVTLLGSMLTQLAVINVGTTVTSIMATFDPITTIIIGVVFLGEKITHIQLLACILILLAVILLALDQNNMAKKRAKHMEQYEDILSK